MDDTPKTNKISSFLSGIPSLTKYMITSMTAIAVYTVIYLWFMKSFALTIPIEFAKLWYGYWGSEIFICAGLRTGKWLVVRSNPFTGSGGTSNTSSLSGSDSDDALGERG